MSQNRKQINSRSRNSDRDDGEFRQIASQMKVAQKRFNNEAITPRQLMLYGQTVKSYVRAMRHVREMFINGYATRERVEENGRVEYRYKLNNAGLDLDSMPYCAYSPAFTVGQLIGRKKQSSKSNILTKLIVGTANPRDHPSPCYDIAR